MQGFDWNLVKSFLAVAEAGSLSIAARMTGVSQPTLGRHIDELEAASGLTLFERGRGGMRPTDAALALLPQARDMLREAERFALVASGREQTIAGPVRITASAIVATYVLPALLRDLHTEEPGLQVEIVASNRVENLLSRDADIAIRMTRPQQNDLIARKAAELSMGGYAQRSYLDRRGLPENVEDLQRHVVVGYDRNDLMLRTMRQMGIAADRQLFAFRTDDQVVGWELVKAGAGIGFGPRILARGVDGLERVLPALAIPSLPMWVATHREVRTSLRIRRVTDFLYDALRTLPFAD